MNNALNLWLLRWQIRLLLVFNRRQAALERVDSLLAIDPDDVYALATRRYGHETRFQQVVQETAVGRESRSVARALIRDLFQNPRGVPPPDVARR